MYGFFRKRPREVWCEYAGDGVCDGECDGTCDYPGHHLATTRKQMRVYVDGVDDDDDSKHVSEPCTPSDARPHPALTPQEVGPSEKGTQGPAHSQDTRHRAYTFVKERQRQMALRCCLNSLLGGSPDALPRLTLGQAQALPELMGGAWKSKWASVAPAQLLDFVVLMAELASVVVEEADGNGDGTGDLQPSLPRALAQALVDLGDPRGFRDGRDRSSTILHLQTLLIPWVCLPCGP